MTPESRQSFSRNNQYGEIKLIIIQLIRAIAEFKSALKTWCTWRKWIIEWTYSSNYTHKNKANHVTLFCVTDLALLTLDREPQWKPQRSSSRHEDQPQWKHQGRWRWVSHLHCSTSLGNIWWWCKICGRCWLPRMDALPRHTQLICFGQNGNRLNITDLQTDNWWSVSRKHTPLPTL